MTKKTAPPATEEEVLADMRRRGRRALIINFVLQGITLITAAASLILYFISVEHGLDVTINHIVQCALALIVFNVPPLLERRFRCYIPNFITVTLYVFAFAHFVLGEIFRAYDHVFLYDKILHTTGGVIFALLSFSVVWLMNQSRDGHVKLSPFFIVLFTFCFTLAVEYVWELIEFGADRLFGANMQRWQDSIIQDAEIFVNGEAVEGDGTFHPVRQRPARFDGGYDRQHRRCLIVCVFAYIGMKKKPKYVYLLSSSPKNSLSAWCASWQSAMPPRAGPRAPCPPNRQFRLEGRARLRPPGRSSRRKSARKGPRTKEKSKNEVYRMDGTYHHRGERPRRGRAVGPYQLRRHRLRHQRRHRPAERQAHLLGLHGRRPRRAGKVCGRCARQVLSARRHRGRGDRQDQRGAERAARARRRVHRLRHL